MYVCMYVCIHTHAHTHSHIYMDAPAAKLFPSSADIVHTENNALVNGEHHRVHVHLCLEIYA
jgi:hypothetical protein